MATTRLLILAVFFMGFTQADVTEAAQSSGSQDRSAYFIQGAVKNPGVYRIESTPSVLKLISLAGGLSETHGTYGFIIRRATPQTETNQTEAVIGREYRLIRVDIRGLLKGEVQNNASLTAGDILNIPPSEVFFVTGEINRIGTFPLIAGITLRQAISGAGGTTIRARIEEVVIFRGNPATGKREEIKVNLRLVMSGDASDVLIEPNDIIVVPGPHSGLMPFIDVPRRQRFAPCRDSLPCIAHSGFTSVEAATTRVW